MDPQQLSWLEQRLRDSNAAWKIGYFHHPLFNGGKHHGPDVDLRSLVAPLFEKYGVNVVFSGHEHVYERLKPVHGI
jgi:3',5'-cyclic AMP phosphodiesterase CpdA